MADGETITIDCNDPRNIHVRAADGRLISGIRRLNLTHKDEQTTAEIDFLVNEFGCIEAHPLLGLETIRAAAARYGFDLVERPVAEAASVAAPKANGIPDHWLAS